jgi:two-component system nitrogen regulation response regulator GlnG
MARVVVVDDEESVCRALKRTIEAMGHEAAVFPTAEKGLKYISESGADLVLLDVRLPGMSGLDAQRELKSKGVDTTVVIITAHGNMDTAIAAMRDGAFEYLAKPVDLAAAQTVIKRALGSRAAAARTVGSEGASPRPGMLVGRTPVMAEVFKRIGSVAGSDASVLILGESGTGKELVARAIHDASNRREEAFEPVNCAALPEPLLESELFGFEKGAFTGATFQKTGKIERANKGTLFLDEIGEIPLGSQAKILRFLQEREIERLGSETRIPVDIRVISASNAPIEKKIAEGTFREDLYYRLNVVTIEIPPLRERIDDLELLVGAFLDELGAAGREVAYSVIETLKAYSWPGNVRQLKNAVEHAFVLSRGGKILKEHLPENLASEERGDNTDAQADGVVARLIAQSGVEKGVYDKFLAAWEKPLIRRVLERFGGNQVKAAEYLGINRATLKKKMVLYGLADMKDSGD